MPGNSGAGAWKDIHAKCVSVHLLCCKRYALNPDDSNRGQKATHLKQTLFTETRL